MIIGKVAQPLKHTEVTELSGATKTAQHWSSLCQIGLCDLCATEVKFLSYPTKIQSQKHTLTSYSAKRSDKIRER